MTWTTAFLLVLFVFTVTLVASLLIPLDRPEPHPYETDPAETHDERRGRHRHPADEDGPTYRLASADRRLPRPFVE